MDKNYKKRLGDLLVEFNKITQADLDRIIKKQGSTGKRLGELLVEDKLVTEDDILDVLEIQLGTQRIFLDAIDVDKKAVLAIPESIASKYLLIPFGFKDDRIKVAMSDPLNIFAFDDVRIASGYEVDAYISSSKEIAKAIDRYYSSQFAQKAAEELSKERSVKISEDEIARSAEVSDVENAPAVRLVDSIIKNAIKAKASDIHIEPFEKFIKVRYRIDGELQEVLSSGKEAHGALITRIKILSNLNIAEKRLPQDGRILTKIGEREVDLRVSTIPTVHGEKVVIRVLTREGFLVGREYLGMSQADSLKLDRIVKSPNGIILVTGPTGSGKSTTLYTILSEMNSSSKNIITIEDPVEYMIEGINQVNVNPKAGMTFAAGLRSILRQDPDIIMVGEIRDSETAEIAIRSAITGHIVLSTVHTNDAPSAPIRLNDMGIERYLVATSLAGVISQRLVRKICNYCRTEYEASDYEKKILGVDINRKIKLIKGRGCPYCNNTGYSGRIGVYEMMEISKEVRKVIMESDNTDDLRAVAVKEGMKTLKMSCIELVAQGITTVDELARIAYLKE